MHIRLKLLAFFFLIAFLALSVRLFFWQILRGATLGREARGQYESERFLDAPRGSILAQDASWLVARADAYLVYAQIPEIKKSPKEIGELLAPFFVEDLGDRASLLAEIDRTRDLLSKKGAVWVPLKQKVSSDIKKNIEALKISGIGFEKKEDRIYPEASTAAQLLGFVGKDDLGRDQGYFGLEGYYNLSLSGKPGFNKGEKDAYGRPIFISEDSQVNAIDGVNLLTNIDKSVQIMVDKKLKDGIEKYEAKGGDVIIMNPRTGGIVAMSSFPSFDPETYWKYSDELFKNPAVSSTFEPGSIFKVIVMASALDAGAVKPDTKCDICSAPLKVDKYVIETWNNEYNPDSTMLDVIVHSDNVGMAFVGQKLGADKLYDYLTKFGIGGLTGIDLQGEVTAKLRDRGTWNIVDLATASFGQGIAVTPIQMIKAVGAIANGGISVVPQVVKKLKGDNWEQNIEPKMLPRAVSEKAAKDITAMMVEAAKNGESKWTALRGFKVAGKTGTAQIPIAGHYDAEKTIASFVGFAPADKPLFVMLVSLQEPKTSQWASETAAPLWYSIAKDLFMYFGIQPLN